MVRISNLELVELLRKNGRTSYSNLATKLNVSETAIRKKMKKLEEQGTIMQYTIEVNPTKLGFESKALIGIDTRPEDYTTLTESLMANPNVRSLFTSAGEHMLICEVWFENSEKMRNFVKQISETKGVTKVCPAIMLEKVK